MVAPRAPCPHQRAALRRASTSRTVRQATRREPACSSAITHRRRRRPQRPGYPAKPGASSRSSELEPASAPSTTIRFHTRGASLLSIRCFTKSLQYIAWLRDVVPCPSNSYPNCWPRMRRGRRSAAKHHLSCVGATPQGAGTVVVLRSWQDRRTGVTRFQGRRITEIEPSTRFSSQLPTLRIELSTKRAEKSPIRVKVASSKQNASRSGDSSAGSISRPVVG
jgi:hypothetical protein